MSAPPKTGPVSPAIKQAGDAELEKWEPPIKEIIKRSRASSRSKESHSITGSLPKIAVVLIPGIAMIFLLVWLIGKPPSLKYICNGSTGNQELPTGRYSCGLMFADNCSILIDSTFKGVIIRQGNTDVIQPEPGNRI